jgi:transcriptional regulator with XRE-family HTH domain
MEGELVSSPEQLGEFLGVSGPTIRRWETGRSTPSHFDLQRFAEVCRLSPIETAFLIEAFSARELEQPPEVETFRRAADEVLALPFPAYLLDSFFYLRAWNSYMAALDGPAIGSGQPTNVLRGPILAATRPNESEDPDHRLWRWLSDFWYSSASLCGSIAYKRLLRELGTIPGFDEKWRRMALERNPWQSWSFNAPYHFQNASLGDYSVFPSKIGLPPTYHLRVYVPRDDLARDRLDAVTREPPRVAILPEVHWSSRFVKTT